ncbi:hypothetical protein [Anaeromyxobacter terrae]|uniref:hypothetical protein n=1 Tax=Anaeromyxobacter terrae TaxID=2925406 RepID=UPI001F5A8AA5|nr:hypothetical protein [Anaeromyxobacter sp. SG22]
MTSEKHDTLFAGLPRRRRLAGLVTIALWLGIGAAFVTDMVPTRSSIDWLYGVEARRDAYARVLAARAAQQTPAPRRAARAVPAAAAAITRTASQAHAPEAAICQAP